MRRKRKANRILGIGMAVIMMLTTPMSVLAVNETVEDYDMQSVSAVEEYTDTAEEMTENVQDEEESLGEIAETDFAELEDATELIQEEAGEEQLIGEQSLEGDIPVVQEEDPTEEGDISEDTESKRTEEECLTALYDAFKNYKVNTPLEFPYGTGEGEYTNAKDFIQAEIEKIVPKSEYEVEFHYTGTLAGTSGSETTMDATTLDIAPIHAPVNTKPGFLNVTFSIGDKTSGKITPLYLSVKPLPVTAMEAVEYEAALLNFNTIKGQNTSEDFIVSSVGKLSGSTVGALPTTAEIYKNSNKDLEVGITWSLELASGTEGSMVLAANNKTTVTRPNVGQEDAKYRLTATFANKTDSTINKTVTFDLTVPAFEASVLPVRVTPADAVLTVTDNYYKKAVDAQYIETSDDGALRRLTLHGGSNGTSAQTYSWIAEKEGYITQKGTFSVGSGEQPEQTVTLMASSEDDAKLNSLEVTSPAPDAPSIKTPMGTFDKDKEAYELTVGAIDSVTIKASACVPEATVKIKRHSSVVNANKGTYTTGNLTASGSTCYLKTDGDTVIEITVTAPTGSTQTVTTKTYTLTVKKSGETAHSLSKLALKSSNSEGKAISINTLSNTGYTEEDVCTPSVDQGGIADVYVSQVNYYHDQISITPTLVTKTDTIKITYQQGEEKKEIAVDNGKASAAIPLEVGDNFIDVTVTKTDNTETENYHLQVHRKQEPEGMLSLEGTEETFPFVTESDWTGRINFPHSLRELSLKLTIPEQVTVSLQGEDKEYRNGDIITIPVGDKESQMVTLFWVRTVQGEGSEDVMEPQKYVINFKRAPSEAPDFLGSYLPAPGQFVNEDMYKDPSVTLAGPKSGRMVTLGSFGGSIVYKFDTPIENSSQNPYGIDFIVFGNVQKAADGMNYDSGKEPAGVMVSQDGSTWYELAGSDYYERDTQHNISMTYTNPDTTFTSSVDIPWTDTTGRTGSVKSNTYHVHSYYPDPLTYEDLNKGIGENTTYTEKSMTVSGSRVSNSAALHFGYGDTHANADGNLSTASNPYKENPLYDTNGDGMDISWAVDANGNPVHLDSIQYVKIYTAQSKDNGSMGEVSSEVSGVFRAKQAEASVGTTKDLQNIIIDGKQINLTAGTYTYDVTVKDVSAFKVIPTARTDSNIYVSNQRVKSGKLSKTVSVQDTLRVIVQDGQKEPVIYYFHLTGTEQPADSTALKSVSVMPGALEAEETEDGYTISVPDTCQKIRLMAAPQNENASVKINGTTVFARKDYLSEVLTLEEGDTVIQVEVTSESAAVTKTYPVTIKRVPLEEQQSIQVTFSLVGDEVHPTGKHIWSSLWLDQISVRVPQDCTAKYVTEMMFLNNDISFEEKNGNYIEIIQGLTEFDNGPKSGWMYSINGTTENVDAMDIQHITADCEIIWFYVDDYTTEGVPDLDHLNEHHVCVWKDASIIKKPGCETTGSKTQICPYCKKTRTVSIPAAGHKYGRWITTSQATVSAQAVQTHICNVCKKKETRKTGSKLKPVMTVNMSTIPLKVKQKTNVLRVTGLAKGDKVQSYKSGNTRIFTVSENGIITAGKKTGKALLTITLASGLKKQITVKVQKKAVATTKITGLTSKVTVKKGQKLTLKPGRIPLTSTQKFTYKSANKKIASISGKGVITAKKAGKTRITVKSGKKKYTVTVTVTK